MKRYKFKHPPIQSNLLLQYFVTNMYNTDLPSVNSRDLSEYLRRHVYVTHRHAFV